jgi:hypothetical protein
LNTNTSSRVIAQPNIIRQERNSNLNCNSSRYSWLYLDELQFKFEFCSGRMIFGWVIALELVFFVQIWSCPDFFNCNSSRYIQIPNIKSIYQRTSRKSLDNLKFEQKYKFKGHNSAKKLEFRSGRMIFGWAMALELVFVFKF